MEIDRRLKWLQGRLEKLAQEHQRNIAMNAKTREAKELLSKMFEIQTLIDNEDDLTAQFVHQEMYDECEQIRRELISPRQVFQFA